MCLLVKKNKSKISSIIAKYIYYLYDRIRRPIFMLLYSSIVIFKFGIVGLSHKIYIDLQFTVLYDIVQLLIICTCICIYIWIFIASHARYTIGYSILTLQTSTIVGTKLSDRYLILHCKGPYRRISKYHEDLSYFYMTCTMSLSHSLVLIGSRLLLGLK